LLNTVPTDTMSVAYISCRKQFQVLVSIVMNLQTGFGEIDHWIDHREAKCGTSIHIIRRLAWSYPTLLFELSTEVLKSHSHQYLTRYTKLEQLFGSAGQSLGNAVVQFSRLKRIELGSLWHWNRKRDEYAPGDKGIILEECTESSCQIKLDSDQATMVLKAIARGAFPFWS